jgi:hypothetical protein
MCGSFAEGFDTPDLQDARSLLFARPVPIPSTAEREAGTKP